MTPVYGKTNGAILVIVLMIVTLVGFYPTYISKFPSFEDVTTVHHFHGAMMMLWFSFLIVQPLLITYKKYSLHRALGKISYVVAPLVLYSIFLASQHEYYRDLTHSTEAESLAGLALDMTSIVAFGICYGLAIRNVKNTQVHMRYMVGTILIMMGPGIMRIVLVYQPFSQVSFPTGVLYTFIISLGIGLALLAFDLLKGKPYKPYLVALSLMTGIYLAFIYRMSDWWQAIAGAIAIVF